MTNIAISNLMLKDDHRFLNEMMRKLPGRPMEIMGEYKKQFISGMESEPSIIKKNNAGRKKANTWLLIQEGRSRG